MLDQPIESVPVANRDRALYVCSQEGLIAMFNLEAEVKAYDDAIDIVQRVVRANLLQLDKPTRKLLRRVVLHLMVARIQLRMYGRRIL